MQQGEAGLNGEGGPGGPGGPGGMHFQFRVRLTWHAPYHLQRVLYATPAALEACIAAGLLQALE